MSFGWYLERMLIERGMGISDLARLLSHSPSRQFLNQIVLEKKKPTPKLIEDISAVLSLKKGDRIALMRMAAVDRGFDIGN